MKKFVLNFFLVSSVWSSVTWKMNNSNCGYHFSSTSWMLGNVLYLQQVIISSSDHPMK